MQLVLTAYGTTKLSEVNKSTFYRENIRKFMDNSMNDMQKHEILLLILATYCNIRTPEANITTFYHEKCLKMLKV